MAKRKSTKPEEDILSEKPVSKASEVTAEQFAEFQKTVMGAIKAAPLMLPAPAAVEPSKTPVLKETIAPVVVKAHGALREPVTTRLPSGAFCTDY
jgi:hypothetical protein